MRNKNDYARLASNFEEVQKNDLVVLNNPVLIQGLGLSPVVMAATTLRNSLILSLAALLLIVVTRAIAAGFLQSVAYRLRTMLCVLIAAVVYAPVLFAMYWLFGHNVVYVGIYLPLLVVDQVLLSRCELLRAERFGAALRTSLQTALGFALAICFCGALREFVGAGALMGKKILAEGLLPLLQTTPGGFLTAALAAAALQWFVSVFKRTANRRTATSVQ